LRATFSREQSVAGGNPEVLPNLTATTISLMKLLAIPLGEQTTLTKWLVIAKTAFCHVPSATYLAAKGMG